MAITFTEKPKWLDQHLADQGHFLKRRHGVWISDDDAAVQSIIDNFDALPYARAEAIEAVKKASAEKRLQYVTDAAGKDTEYGLKAEEAKQFDADGTVGVFMQGRINQTGEAAATVAAEWNFKAAAWTTIAANIAGLVDDATQRIGKSTDWKQCEIIASTAIAQIEAI